MVGLVGGADDKGQEMGPMEDSVVAKGDSRLEAAREAYPAWDIHRVFGGYEAVPKGTVVIRSVDVDGVVEKIRRQS